MPPPTDAMIIICSVVRKGTLSPSVLSLLLRLPMELFARAAHFSSMGTCIEGAALGAIVMRLGSALGCDDGDGVGDELGFDVMVGA